MYPDRLHGLGPRHLRHGPQVPQRRHVLELLRHHPRLQLILLRAGGLGGGSQRVHMLSQVWPQRHSGAAACTQST